MKILLVRHHDIGNVNTRLPESINKAQGIYPPLSLAYIAAALEENHEVNILDSQALNLTTEETKREIEKFSPDLVGVTAMTSNLKGALEIARLTKEVSKDIVTVLGGPHMFVFPIETLSYDYVDFGVAGEGEIVMPELISSLERGKFNEVDGLIFRENGIVKYNPAKKYVEDLDSLAFPARHLLPNKKYFSILADYPFTTMITSRGCPFHCGYCFKKHLDSIQRFRSAKNVVDEIEECLRMGFREIWFYDDMFTANRKHVVDICNEILARRLDFKWEAVTRVDCVDEQLLRLMKKAGCKRLRYGIENGNQEIIDSMKKGITLEQAKKAIEMSKLAGIETFAFFMLGYPGETADQIKNTIDFARELRPDWAMFSNTVPYPCTELLDIAHEKGLLTEKDYWKNFTLGKTEGRIPYDFPGLDAWVELAYKRFYFRPKFFLNTLPKMKNFRQTMRYLLGFLALVKFRSFEV